MPDSNVAITAGSGTSIDTFQLAGGDHQQIVREAPATAEAEVTWTPSTTANTTFLAADASRTGILMVNNSTVRVYLRCDTTAPTAALFHWFLEPGDRWEVPEDRRCLAWSTWAPNAGTGSFIASTGTAV